jgi:hypothetical protein
MVTSRGWAGRGMFNVYRISVWEQEKVLEMEGDDGVYLMPLNHILKMG